MSSSGGVSDRGDDVAAKLRGYDPIDVKQRTCKRCGMLLDDAGEFHPYAFCVWKKAGLDPWDQLRWTVEAVGQDITHWPKRPPLVRNLR